MDALCARTARTQSMQADAHLPEPDYDGSSGEYQRREESVLSGSNIRKNMPVEIKELNKDIKFRAKQDVQKRPEFLAKQHELKSKALQKEEKEKEEQSELFVKLRSKSKQIEEHEKQQELEESKPEFMKVKLKGNPP